MNKPAGILAWPAYATREGNPYNYILYSNIEKKGYKVHEFMFTPRCVLRALLFQNYKILHIHWPSSILSYSNHFKASLRLILFRLFINTIKLFNKKVIWTVHNLEAHESKNAALQKKMYSFLYKKADGFISLNRDGLKIIKEKAASAGRQKFCYIPHPHYRGYYPNETSMEAARKQLSVPAGKFVILFIGQIRTYKNVTGLIRAFKELDLENKYLLIAGGVHPEVRDQLFKEAEGLDEFQLNEKFLPDSELQVYLNASDLVVTPYSNIFNSGSVFLNLSFNKPTLAPALGIFPELREVAGPQYIKLFSGKLDSGQLLKSVVEVEAESDIVMQPDLSSFDPDHVASETIAFYEQFL